MDFFRRTTQRIMKHRYIGIKHQKMLVTEIRSTTYVLLSSARIRLSVNRIRQPTNMALKQTVLVIIVSVFVYKLTGVFIANTFDGSEYKKLQE